MCSRIERSQRPQDRDSSLVVAPDDRGHGEHAVGEADDDALEGAAAVLFQAEPALQRVVDRLDQLPRRLALAAPFPLERRAEQLRALEGEIGLELLGSEALVGGQEQAWPAVVRSGSRAGMAASTSRSPIFGLARAQVIGIPVGVQTRNRRRPQ